MEKREELKKYITNGKLDMNRLIAQYFSYVYTVVRNYKNSNMSEEDVEEIILDVFIAIWNNRNQIKDNIAITSYLAGIARNIIYKRYRDNKPTYSLNEYESVLFDNIDMDKIELLASKKCARMVCIIELLMIIVGMQIRNFEEISIMISLAIILCSVSMKLAQLVRQKI